MVHSVNVPKGLQARPDRRKAKEGAKVRKPQLRLFQAGAMVGYRRSHRTTQCHTSLINIKDVHDPKSARFYVGKRVAYIFKGIKDVAQLNSRKHSRTARARVVWGRITRAHGNSGVVRAKFQTNLPTHAVGRQVRVYLFPSNI
eukprot:TRINITY_DN57405_c0_g1_i1.p1 TRINITY_DN57405_c0_g1~~TRINITY_DN57405_c0_g1_i1.p1  ORF type:complete len:143 (-),score=28.58 TRINITY_DN57405_c0_g1_i1:254-682(-)